MMAMRINPGVGNDYPGFGWNSLKSAKWANFGENDSENPAMD
jgi:hypothetical protein